MNELAMNEKTRRAPNLTQEEMALFASINRPVPVGIAS
jgi:hypothetical protein